MWGQLLSLNHTLAFPWHFTFFKALSQPLSYLILTTTPKVGSTGIFIPILQIRTLGLRKMEICPKVTGYPKLEETRTVASLGWLLQGPFYQITPSCAVGIWRSRDWEAEIIGVLDVGFVQCTRWVCLAALFMQFWRLRWGATHIKTSSATMAQNKVRHKAERWLILCAAPMLRPVQQLLWLLLLPPLDSAPA